MKFQKMHNLAILFLFATAFACAEQTTFFYQNFSSHAQVRTGPLAAFMKDMPPEVTVMVSAASGQIFEGAVYRVTVNYGVAQKSVIFCPATAEVTVCHVPVDQERITVSVGVLREVDAAVSK